MPGTPGRCGLHPCTKDTCHPGVGPGLLGWDEAELRPFGDSDGVLRGTLAVPILGQLGMVVLLPMTRWAIIASVFRAIVPLRGTLGGVVLDLVPAVGPLGIFHVGVLVDDRHHVAHGLGIALGHLSP